MGHANHGNQSVFGNWRIKCIKYQQLIQDAFVALDPKAIHYPIRLISLVITKKYLNIARRRIGNEC